MGLINSFDPSKGLDQLPASSNEGASGGSLLDGIMGSAGGSLPLNLQSSARADSRASSSAVVDFNTGSFSVGGSKSTNTLLIVAGVIALAFLFFNKSKLRKR
jgi:hypothetical protein